MPREKIEHALTLLDIAEKISKGQSRQKVINDMMAEGVPYDTASQLYYQGLRELTPDENVLDEYRRGIMQVNLDRLEKIINSCIEGNTGEKKVALQAIDQMSKLLGLYNDGNKVTIANNKEGDQIVQIDFK